jgi:hypothetical protein
MDPNANLREQQDIMERARTVRLIRAGKLLAMNYGPGLWETDNGLVDSRGDTGRLRELREALQGWLANGGFEPDWTLAPKAAKYYGR